MTREQKLKHLLSYHNQLTNEYKALRLQSDEMPLEYSEYLKETLWDVHVEIQSMLLPE